MQQRCSNRPVLVTSLERPDVQVLDEERRLKALLEAKAGQEDYNEREGRQQIAGRLKSLGESIEQIITVLLKRSPSEEVAGELGNVQAGPRFGREDPRCA